MLRILKQFILTVIFATFATQSSAMFIQPDWYDPTQPGVGTNRYSYSHNDPINLRDPGGNVAETVWDGFNVGLGLGSAGANFYNGNIGAGLLDLGGVVVDGLATALPVVPGGAATGIQALRARKAVRNARRSPCNSFAGHTLIETDVGLVPISEVVPGDLVWSKNDKTGEVGYNPVTDIFNNLHSSHLALIVEANDKVETIKITKEHPVFVENKGWVPAGELQVGDVIETRDGGGAHVTNLDIIQEALTAYNFEVANYHTYYATQSGLLVHNGWLSDLFGGNKNSDSVGPAQSHEDNRRDARNDGLNGRDGLHSHHSPSVASVDEHLKNNGVELNRAERRQLRNKLGAVLMSAQNHAKTRTYGGKGAATKILDASDLLAAVDADIENLVKDIGVSRDQAEQLRGALKDHVKSVTAAYGAPCG